MKNLFKALAEFQQKVPVIFKGTQGYGYTYADLPEIFKVINPLLKECGLGFYQSVNGKQIKTVVFHIESGEVIESDTDIPQGVVLKGMNEFQVLGSAITYIRRYALSSLLGLVTDKDTDASGEQVKQPEMKPIANPGQPMTNEEFANSVNSYGEPTEPICSSCGSFKKLVPAGVSKATGKPYNAFYSCPNRCRE